MTAYAERMVGVAFEYGPPVVVAIVVLIVGLWIANRVAKAVQGVMEAKELTPPSRGIHNKYISYLIENANNN